MGRFVGLEEEEGCVGAHRSQRGNLKWEIDRFLHCRTGQSPPLADLPSSLGFQGQAKLGKLHETGLRFGSPGKLVVSHAPDMMLLAA